MEDQPGASVNQIQPLRFAAILPADPEKLQPDDPADINDAVYSTLFDPPSPSDNRVIAADYTLPIGTWTDNRFVSAAKCAIKQI